MPALCLSVAVVFLDQTTKSWIHSTFSQGDYVPVYPAFFNLNYVRNTGAAWGTFSGFNNWLVLLSLAMVAIIVAFRRHLLPGSKLNNVVMGLMLGGIVGNLIDRLRLGFVVDFLDFHWKTHHFPAFNVADSSICVGVGLYILSHLIGPKDSPIAEAGGKLPGEPLPPSIAQG